MKQNTGSQPLRPCPDCEHSCSTEATACPNCGRPFPHMTVGLSGKLDDTVFAQILTQSSMKVGMCLTLLGLIKVVEGVKSVTTYADELLAVDAVGFLMSSITAYFAIKQLDPRRKRQLGRAGDIIFTLSLAMLAVICMLLAFIML